MFSVVVVCMFIIYIYIFFFIYFDQGFSVILYKNNDYWCYQVYIYVRWFGGLYGLFSMVGMRLGELLVIKLLGGINCVIYDIVNCIIVEYIEDVLVI